MPSTVLVTAGSGFVGSHTILQAPGRGHRVRTTVRSLRREADVRALLREGGAEPGERLSFFEADLTADAGWPQAVAGCDYVLHVASWAGPRARARTPWSPPPRACSASAC
jgi:nucleoside-diphosphate-sugar epimerase